MPADVVSNSMSMQHETFRVGTFKRAYSYLSFEPTKSVERCTLAFERIGSFVHVGFRTMKMLQALLSKQATSLSIGILLADRLALAVS